jgi:chaperone required for assembly of F1-ATPase
MKRFWDDAAAVPGDAGWGVTLDGKPVRLPGGGALAVPSRALAEAIAAEWQAAGGAKGGEMSYADVPLTRLAGTAQERIAPDPEPVILELARYGETDLLCYRADLPVALAERQAMVWQPWLDWAERRHGARLKVTAGIIHVAQDTAALVELAGAVAALGPFRLAGLGIVVPALGSLVLGLALADAALDAQAACDAAMLDEMYQEALWGVDAEAAARRAHVRTDIGHAARFLALAGQP